MEDAMTTPGRGNPESAAWFRERLRQLGITQNTLTWRMVAAGDDRVPSTIVRSLQRMASGQARVSGEMRSLLCLLGEAALHKADIAMGDAEIDRLSAFIRQAGLKVPAHPNTH